MFLSFLFNGVQRFEEFVRDEIEIRHPCNRDPEQRYLYVVWLLPDVEVRWIARHHHHSIIAMRTLQSSSRPTSNDSVKA